MSLPPDAPGTADTGQPGVVCGVDGSRPAADAAWAAARAADRMDVGLHLVRAFDWPVAGVPGLPEGARGWSAARHSAMAELFRSADRLAAAYPARAVAGALTDGTALSVLTRATAHAALLVVGARGHSGQGGPRTGSVAVGLARATRCPLLVFRAATPGQDPRTGVVVGVDGGPGTGALVAVAARAARGDGRLTVIEKSGAPASSVWTDAAMDELRASHPGLVVERRRHDGVPGALLVELSATASLVVVGRPEGPGELTLTERMGTVLRRGICSTLVVPLVRPPGP